MSERLNEPQRRKQRRRDVDELHITCDCVDVHHYIHFPGLDAAVARAVEVITGRVAQSEKRIMASLESVLTAAQALRDGIAQSNATGNEVVTLIHQLQQSGGLTPAQQALIDQIETTLTEGQTELTGIVADHADALDGPPQP